MSNKTYPQERPSWCPHDLTCEFRQRVIDSMCVGQLKKPQPHGGDLNTHRLCLNGAGEGDGVFDLQINRSDVGWFRWLFEAIFPMSDPSGQTEMNGLDLAERMLLEGPWFVVVYYMWPPWSFETEQEARRFKEKLQKDGMPGVRVWNQERMREWIAKRKYE